LIKKKTTFFYDEDNQDINHITMATSLNIGNWSWYNRWTHPSKRDEVPIPADYIEEQAQRRASSIKSAGENIIDQIYNDKAATSKSIQLPQHNQPTGSVSNTQLAQYRTEGNTMISMYENTFRNHYPQYATKLSPAETAAIHIANRPRRKGYEVAKEYPRHIRPTPKIFLNHHCDRWFYERYDSLRCV
jgi:hypothetical protein